MGTSPDVRQLFFEYRSGGVATRGSVAARESWLSDVECRRRNGAIPLSTGMENGEGGIRTRGRGVYPYDGLANRCLQPLGHLSKPSESL